jgi:hypothetical protein
MARKAAPVRQFDQLASQQEFRVKHSTVHAQSFPACSTESNSATKRILDRILGPLYEEQTLAEHPASFPERYVASVRASERTGALREALTRYIAYGERKEGTHLRP